MFEYRSGLFFVTDPQTYSKIINTRSSLMYAYEFNIFIKWKTILRKKIQSTLWLLWSDVKQKKKYTYTEPHFHHISISLQMWNGTIPFSYLFNGSRVLKCMRNEVEHVLKISLSVYACYMYARFSTTRTLPCPAEFSSAKLFFETALKTAVRIREKIGRRMLKNAIALCNSEEDIYIISEWLMLSKFSA